MAALGTAAFANAAGHAGGGHHRQCRPRAWSTARPGGPGHRRTSARLSASRHRRDWTTAGIASPGHGADPGAGHGPDRGHGSRLTSPPSAPAQVAAHDDDARSSQASPPNRWAAFESDDLRTLSSAQLQALTHRIAIIALSSPPRWPRSPRHAGAGLDQRRRSAPWKPTTWPRWTSAQFAVAHHGAAAGHERPARPRPWAPSDLNLLSTATQVAAIGTAAIASAFNGAGGHGADQRPGAPASPAHSCVR